MLGSQRFHCYDKTNFGVVDSCEEVGQKGRMSSTTDRYRLGILGAQRSADYKVTASVTHSG